MNEEEYYEIVKFILEHPEFQRRKTYMHHENESVYDHSLEVSKLSYKLASKLHLKNKSDVAIGALLHDFYDKPWQDSHAKKKFFEQHGFVHAREAHKNALKYFGDSMNPKIEDMILRHMFPLNIRPPRYIGSWIVTFSDKWVSLRIFKHPTQLPKYVGLKRKEK